MFVPVFIGKINYFGVGFRQPFENRSVNISFYSYHQKEKEPLMEDGQAGVRYKYFVIFFNERGRLKHFVFFQL